MSSCSSSSLPPPFLLLLVLLPSSSSSPSSPLPAPLCSLTCDPSNPPVQVGSHVSGQVSSQADADEVHGAQRGSSLLGGNNKKPSL